MNNNEIIGTVKTDALKLRVRKEPTTVKGVIKTYLKDGSTVVVDSSFTDQYFYKIVKPTKGYVMRRYVVLDGKHTKFSESKTRDPRKTS